MKRRQTWSISSTRKLEAKTDVVYKFYAHDPSKEYNYDNELASLLQNPLTCDSTSVLAAFSLRHQLDFLRDRINDYNQRLEMRNNTGVFAKARSSVAYSSRYYEVERFLQAPSPEPDRYDIEQAPAYVAWATNEVNRLEPLACNMLKKLRVDDQEQRAFDEIMKWLDPSYEVLRVMAEEDSLDKFFDTSSRFDTVIPAIEQQIEERRRNCEEVDRYHSELLMTTNAEDDLVCEIQERDDWHPADQTTDNSEYEPTYMEDDPYAEEEAQETQPERASETFQLNINQPFVQLSPRNVSRAMQQGDPNALINTLANTFSGKN